MKNHFFRSISGWLSAMRRCPYCGAGRARINLLWFVDVDASLTCNRCKAKMAHINFLCTAVLYALGVMLLYVMFQKWGMTYSIEQAKTRTVALAVVVYVAVAALRFALLWLLWWIKNPLSAKDAKKTYIFKKFEI
ncbi:MAG: hypothetical protein LBH84_03210 [Prevotellaceae bacterium]|jgi:NhaP-type Na+/H+ or K+/H+ antiporter|nr:hypothetical protein [Prevotellaceae bacterium]